MSNPTRIAEGPLTHIVLWTVFPLAGGLIGWFLPSIAKWVAGLAWFPWQGPFTLIADTEHITAIVAAVIGVILAILFVLSTYGEMLTLVVDDESVTYEINGEEERFLRSDIEAILHDGKYWVTLGPGGVPLAQEKSDLPLEKVREELQRRGFPWRDADPYADEWLLWLPGNDAVPQGANAVFEARKTAKKKDNLVEVRKYNKELRKLGIAVRDDKADQYWRPLSPR